MKKALIILSSVVFLFGCDLVNSGEVGLSDEEIVTGLKEALRVGTDTSVATVSKADGYFKDELIKLLLPDQVENSLNQFKAKSIDVFGLGTVTGEDIYTTGVPFLGIEPLSATEDEIILGMNRAAETAATEAAPIFWTAITDMTIADGTNILFGGVDTAATEYLNENTRPELFTKFEPVMENALQTVKVGDTSLVYKYEQFIVDYNKVLNTTVPTGLFTSSTVGEMMNVNTVTATDLSQYATDKGLNGLFSKVAIQEKKIREDPAARVTEILESVFGELDE